MRTRFGSADEMNPFLDQALSRQICGMRLAGEHELHRLPRVGQQAQQSGRILQQEIGPLVHGEAAREAERQRIFAEHLSGAFNLFAARPDTARCRESRSRA